MKNFIVETPKSIEFAYSLFGVNISLENRSFNFCTTCRNELKTLIRVFTQCRAEFGSENREEAYECLFAVENDIKNDEIMGLWSTNEFDPSVLERIDETTYGGKPYAREYLLSKTSERVSSLKTELSDTIEF